MLEGMDSRKFRRSLFSGDGRIEKTLFRDLFDCDERHRRKRITNLFLSLLGLCVSYLGWAAMLCNNGILDILGSMFFVFGMIFLLSATSLAKLAALRGEE